VWSGDDEEGGGCGESARHRGAGVSLLPLPLPHDSSVAPGYPQTPKIFPSPRCKPRPQNFSRPSDKVVNETARGQRSPEPLTTRPPRARMRLHNERPTMHTYSDPFKEALTQLEETAASDRINELKKRVGLSPATAAPQSHDQSSIVQALKSMKAAGKATYYIDEGARTVPPPFDGGESFKATTNWWSKLEPTIDKLLGPKVAGVPPKNILRDITFVPYPLLMIEWHDSRQPSADWERIAATQKGHQGPATVVSVGYKVYEDDRSIVLAQSVADAHDDLQTTGRMTIARKAITKTHLISQLAV